MPCYTEHPSESWAEHLEKMLCHACRFLTKEEMVGYLDNSGWQGLFEWYAEHLIIDYRNNEPAEKLWRANEANRLGLEIIERQGFSELRRKE